MDFMSYRFNENEILMFESDDFRENKFIFPNKKGFLQISKEKITDEIFLFQNKAFANDDVDMVFDEFSSEFFADSVYIVIATNGMLEVVRREHNFIYESSKTIIHKNENFSQASYKLLKDQNISGLSFVVKKSLFEKAKIKIPKTYILKNTNSNLKSNILAKQILASQHKGALNEIYIQSKALEIVFLELLSLSEKPSHHEVKFDEFDMKALENAREILENSPEFPSINKLSRMVSLNEFKLKLGFQKYFGETLYQFSLKSRLNLAKKLLQKESLSIAQISQQIGFKHQQSFSVAFSKYFGVCPKDMRKSKKFYI